MILPWLLSATLLLVLWFVAVRIMRMRRRAALLSDPPPAKWDAVCRRHIRWFDRLPHADQQRLLQLARAFIEEKRFEACGGLAEVTEEMKVVIAALACSLVLHRPPPHYPRLRSILLYPTGFEVPAEPTGLVRADPFQTTELMDTDPQSLIGESWLHGSVVLAWDSIVNPADPATRDTSVDNVALHEFAHQLDEEGPAGEGVPLLGSRREYERWQRVFTEAYERLRSRVRRGAPSALDPYATTNPAEFFAVATETFFERPDVLKRAYPGVHEALADFYGIDLACDAEQRPGAADTAPSAPPHS